jgi:hypothetical protein
LVGIEFYSGALSKSCFDIIDLSKMRNYIVQISYLSFSDVIFTEVGGGMPSAMGTEEMTPIGSYICQYDKV